MVATMLLGLTVAVLGFFALMMWADARDARDDAAAATPAAATGQDHSTAHNTALPLNSFAGVVPENAQALAEAHKATAATLPPIPAGDVKIADKGLYPFVSHAFADVDLGQVGLLKVGDPKGSMTH
jgi:hypothetical protein